MPKSIYEHRRRRVPRVQRDARLQRECVVCMMTGSGLPPGTMDNLSPRQKAMLHALDESNIEHEAKLVLGFMIALGKRQFVICKEHEPWFAENEEGISSVLYGESAIE